MAEVEQKAPPPPPPAQKKPQQQQQQQKKQKTQAQPQNQQQQQQELLYLNPLTMEAIYFLETLEEATRQNTQLQMDPMLSKMFERIIAGIEKYLDKKPVFIAPSKEVKFVQPQDMKTIKRTFSCSSAACNNRIVGTSIVKVVGHLAEKHAKLTFAKPTKEERKIKKEERKKAKEEQRKQKPIVLPKKAKALISNEMAEVCRANYQMAEKLKIIPDYDLIDKALCQLIQPKFENQPVRVYKFGSRMSGIGNRASDLDLFVDIGNTFHTFEHRASPETQKKLKDVEKALNNDKEWRIINVIRNARVPIIKVSHRPTGIECDIGFSNSLGYCNTNLMKYIFETQPIVQYMCIYVKKWLNRSKLSDHISTYSMCLMVLYFLQIKKALPSIKRLQEDVADRQMVGPWIANFAHKSLSDLGIESTEVSIQLVKDYLKMFFEYFANFNYEKYLVCPYLGKESVEIKTYAQRLPERYAEYVAQNPDFGLQLEKCMVVQDPIQLNHNVTKSISILILEQFKGYCRETAVLIGELENSRPPNKLENGAAASSKSNDLETKL